MKRRLNSRLIALKKFIPSLLSIVVIIGIYIWFQARFTDKKIVLIPERKQTYFNIQANEKVFLHEPFKAKIELDTNRKSVNAIGINISFPSDKLQVTNIDTTQSFCQFYPEKKFDNQLGTISLSCGSPSPGFSGENDVVTIDFIPIKIGTATLKFNDSSRILLSDGEGTNSLFEFPSSQINVVNSI